MSIAFFDLDKTLIADNSAKLWLKAQWGAREISFAQMLQASFWLTKYHLGFTKLEEVILKAIALAEGEKQSDMLRRTSSFYRSRIKNLYRPGALSALEEHKRAGQQVSLLTSAFDGLSNLVQKELDFDHCLCTRLEVDEEGFYTGRSAGPLCFGKHKVAYAEKLCHDQQTRLEDCTFYTDSASDIPLLELVGQPVAVNPDPHLRARAQLKRWEIVDWGRPLHS